MLNCYMHDSGPQESMTIPSLDAAAPRKRPHLFSEQPAVEEHAVSILDSAVLRDQEEEENYGELLDAMLGGISDDEEPVMLVEDNAAQAYYEAMKTCVPVPASTTLSPISNAVPTPQPLYINGPYVSSPVTPAGSSHNNLLQPSTSTQSVTSTQPWFMSDAAGSSDHSQAPSTSISSWSTEETPLYPNRWDDDYDYDVMSEFSKTSMEKDNIADIIGGMVDDTGYTDELDVGDEFLKSCENINQE